MSAIGRNREIVDQSKARDWASNIWSGVVIQLKMLTDAEFNMVIVVSVVRDLMLIVKNHSNSLQLSHPTVGICYSIKNISHFACFNA